eukprot:CAMPEP_0176467120 /NCGR_PEP_ID=MMETSP0127-20121128/38281_1 /TAXON_ID=938130 /ORGANISM="Platyophrya macrostoma, Strain WH" /LENGTH=193 /DNA_ID=CAMNT_0017860383 /DNA_START=58 /DNA_END=635 /DNA_ORIENTATION=-
MNMASTSDPTQFCTGAGSVMLNGFQGAYGGNRCVLYLFGHWSVNSKAKYFFAVFGTFLIGILLNGLTFLRRWFVGYLEAKYPAPKGATVGVGAGAPLYLMFIASFTYASQMLFAYFAMLLVMLYEKFIFTGLVLGLMVGHFLFDVYLVRRIKLGGQSVSGEWETMCCGGCNCVAPQQEAAKVVDNTLVAPCEP